MKAQEKAAVKGLPVEELKVQLSECENKLFKLDLARSMTPLKNALEIRNLRRHRARLKTWIRQKQHRS